MSVEYNSLYPDLINVMIMGEVCTCTQFVIDGVTIKLFLNEYAVLYLYFWNTPRCCNMWGTILGFGLKIRPKSVN